MTWMTDERHCDHIRWAKYILPDEAFDTLAEALGAVSITRYPGDRANHIVHHEGFIWRESDLPDRNPYEEP